MVKLKGEEDEEGEEVEEEKAGSCLYRGAMGLEYDKYAALQASIIFLAGLPSTSSFCC